MLKCKYCNGDALIDYASAMKILCIACFTSSDVGVPRRRRPAAVRPRATRRALRHGTTVDPQRERSPMNVKRTCLSLALTLMAPAAAMAASGNLVGYGYAQIYQSNSTVTLLNVTIPSGFRGGELKAIKCIFPSS